MDQLVSFVRDSIPDLSLTQISMLRNKFEESGVTDVESLQYLQPSELTDILKLVPARKLLQAAKRSSMLNTDLTSSPEIPQSFPMAHTNTSTSDSDHGVEDADLFWVDKFQIPWHMLPKSFIDACKSKQRPAEDIRRAAVRTLSFCITEYAKKPTSSEIDKIAAKMVAKYPESLGDFIMGKMLDTGYGSLKKNILDRIHNLNRSSSSSSSNPSSEADITVTTTVPSSKYGCLTSWSGDMKEGSEPQLRKKMFFMQEEFVKTDTCHAVIEEYMQETYPLQRYMINNSSSEEVSNNFPFLYKLKYLEIHFKRLTGFDLTNYVKEKKKLAVIHYLRNEKNNALKKAIAEMDCRVKDSNHHFKMVAFIGLLLSYFKEDKLVEYHQPCVNTKQVEDIKRKEGAPVIAVIGDIYSPLYFHIVFEGKIRATLNSIDDAVMLLFGLYYVFNLEYHSHAAQTLEFIQRVLIGINPVRGSKVVLLASQISNDE